jgi:hypothetical protein
MSAASLVQFIHEFAEIADVEYDEQVHNSEGDTPEVLAIVLAAIRDARADLGTLAKKVESHLLAISGEKRFVVAGSVRSRSDVGETHQRGQPCAHRSSSRSLWTNGNWTRKPASTTGMGSGRAVLMECARPNWRVTPLRARGLRSTSSVTKNTTATASCCHRGKQ